MSFVPAISQRDALALFGALAAVVVLGLVLRRGSTLPPSSSASVPPPLPDGGEPDQDAGTGEDEVGADAWVPDEGAAWAGTLAVTSDGWAFMPGGDRDRLRLIPPVTPKEMEQVGPRPQADQLVRGDLIAARVKRGAPDHDPWRLEALGRDGEYRAWRFETEDAARAALTLVSRSIVVAPRDDDGAEVAMGDADFVEARQREEEIERELASMPDVEERPDEPLRRPYE